MAIDCGTTGIRSIIFSHDATIQSQAYESLTQIIPHPGWGELNPSEIWDKCQTVMKQSLKTKKISPKDIAAVGLTAQRSTNLLWDKTTGKPVYNAITWQDTRTAELNANIDKTTKMRFIRGLGKTTKSFSKLIPAIKKTTSGARLITAATLTFPTASSLGHTRWILDNVQKAHDKLTHHTLLFGTIDTWILWNLTKRQHHVTDYSCASSTGMFDTFKFQWSDLFLDLFNIPKEILPEIKDTSADYGQIHPDILGKEIPIGSAVADQQSSLFADGCFNPGDIKATNGTGTFIDMNVGTHPPASMHKLLPLIAWRLNGTTTYMLEGMINTTGSAIQWIKDNLGLIKDIDETNTLAQSVPDTSGVYFVPAFTGLSSPYWDPHASGIVIGLNRKTQKAHLIRAALEGIIYRCTDVTEAMKQDTSLPINTITADGGASKNDFLLQFLADMLNSEVHRPKILDSTALGAAFLAGLAIDYWSTPEEIKEKRVMDTIFTPQITHEKRQQLYKKWQQAIQRSVHWYTPTQ